MENKKSIVRTVIFKREWQGKGIFEITMDNGDKGEYFSNATTQSAFNEGSEIEYIIEKKEKNGYTNFYIKPANKGFGGPKVNPLHENKRVSLKCAVELACAGKIELNKISEYSNNFLKYLSGE